MRQRNILWGTFVVTGLVLIAAAQPVKGEFRRVADLNPGSAGSYPSNMTSFASSLYFTAYTLATGFELWKSDGQTIQLMADINDTADDIGFGVKEGNDSIPSWLTEFNGVLYFSAYDPYRGAELWRYNGTTASRVADISPDMNDMEKFNPNSSWPNQLTVFNNALYFGANSGTVSTNYELWKYDGVLPSRVANIKADIGMDHSSYPIGLTVFNGALYFMANDGVNGYELWKHNGTSTILLTNINPGAAESSSYPKYFTPLGNHLYFQAFHNDLGFELWRTDGTNVSLAADISAGTGSSNPEFLAELNGVLYFRATDGVNGYELWKFDGNNATLVADINPTGDSYPKNVTIFQGSLYFAADDGGHGFELWKFDGISATRVGDVNQVGDSFPESLTVFDGSLYFVATSPETGYEVWEYDGSTINLAGDINPGSGDSYPQFLTAFNGELYFRATEDGVSNWELWAITPGNSAPTISISAPAEGAVFLSTDTITLEANATDDGSVTMVEFFANGLSVGSDTVPPFSTTTTLAAGSYSLTARATDNSGQETSSGAVTITVTNPGNQAPMVTLASEQANTVLLTPATVVLEATASDPDGTISQVQFFDGSVLMEAVAIPPYRITSGNLPAGVHNFSAVATDNLGTKTTSAVIQVTVVSSPEITSIQKNGELVQLTVSGTSGVPHVLEESSDLQAWTGASTNTPSGGIVSFTRPTTEPHKFFRVRVE